VAKEIKPLLKYKTLKCLYKVGKSEKTAFKLPSLQPKRWRRWHNAGLDITWLVYKAVSARLALVRLKIRTVKA